MVLMQRGFAPFCQIWAGKTMVPSLMVMPLPGPARMQVHSSFLIWRVGLTNSRLQVLPSSSL